jgi:hypothetical protein
VFQLVAGRLKLDQTLWRAFAWLPFAQQVG